MERIKLNGIKNQSLDKRISAKGIEQVKKEKMAPVLVKDPNVDSMMSGRNVVPDNLNRLTDVELSAFRGAGLNNVEISRQIELLGDMHLFRGTSPDFPGNPVLQKLGISPASTDPLVSTVFALESQTKGANGVVLFGSRGSFSADIDMGNVRNLLEREVQVGISPTEFAQRASNSISVNDSRRILSDMGVANLPPAIRSTEEATRILQSTPRLTPEQIQDFIFRTQNR